MEEDRTNDDRMRFRVRKGDVEVEVEGHTSYVKEKFESLLENLLEKSVLARGEREYGIPDALQGMVEKTPEGRAYLSFPVDLLTSKEALTLFLYALKPKKLSDHELSEILTSGWKTIRAEAVRARASELRRDGKLVSETGLYTLSGAGMQWVENEILNKIKQATQQGLEKS